jgi:predicted NACHT family NTPase
VVLKAIEHHHGLLVERARNIYSFSHLTFQEYFTAKAIERGQQLEILVQNISNPRWKEVFYLTAEMLWRSDNFLKLMKQRIDGMLADDEKLQSFLEWTNQKTNSVEFRCKTVAVRAFYGYVEALSRNRDRDRALFLALALDRSLDRSLERDLVVDRDLALALDLAYALDLVLALALDSALARDLYLACARARDLGDNVLRQALQALKSQLPSDREEFYQWWENHGGQWRNELRQVCIYRRNIGLDWQFTYKQVELLNQYYAANLLLVECMNRSYVSKQVREEIESTMLLPSKK